MWDVTVESTDPDLTTTAAVKLALGTTATSDDALLSAIVRRASRWAERYVGYPLSAQKYLETLPGYGTRRLVLSHAPVLSVPGMFYGTDSGDYVQLTSTEFALDRQAGMLERAIGWEWTVPVDSELALRPTVGQEFPQWRAEYVAGYTYAGLTTDSSLWSTEKGSTSTGRTLPEDIEDAVVRKAVAIYEGTDDVMEKQVGDLRIRYGGFGQQSVRSDSAAALLDPWRRVA